MNTFDGDTDDRQILYEGDPLLMSPRNSGKALNPNNQVSFAKDEDFDILEATAVLDNADFGTRTSTHQTAQLARQVDGSATTYPHPDTMLSTTVTASTHPREGLDFFPLTVHVAERTYAAGNIPGSFFRREA